MNEITTTVEITDRTGHTTLQLTQQETLDRVAGTEGAWVFAGDRMVQPAELAEANWDTVGTVRLVPSLVIGCKHGRNPSACEECQEQVIGKFREIHGDTYDYSRVEYTGTQNNVTIVCEKHGPFEQAPNSHLAGSGCPVCGRISLSEKSTHTQEQVIGKFREIHGDTYDYSRVEYSGNSIKVTIVCHEHGSFEQPPSSHKSGQGCPDCSTLGFRNNQPGYYYCLSILGHGGHWWFKGGISGDPQRRAGQIQSSLRGSGLLLDVIVVDSIRFERGIDARNLESKLLKVEGIRTFTIERFDGSRELFSNNPIEFAQAKGWA